MFIRKQGKTNPNKWIEIVIPMPGRITSKPTTCSNVNIILVFVVVCVSINKLLVMCVWVFMRERVVADKKVQKKNHFSMIVSIYLQKYKGVWNHILEPWLILIYIHICMYICVYMYSSVMHTYIRSIQYTLAYICARDRKVVYCITICHVHA